MPNHIDTLVNLCFSRDVVEVKKILELDPSIINSKRITAGNLSVLPDQKEQDFLTVGKTIATQVCLGFDIRDLYSKDVFLYQATPLHAALFSANEPVISYLLDNGADPSISLDIHSYVLHWFSHPLIGYHEKYSVHPQHKWIENISCVILALLTTSNKLLKQIIDKLDDKAISQIFSSMHVKGLNVKALDVFFGTGKEAKLNSLDVALRISNYAALEMLFNSALRTPEGTQQLQEWLFTQNAYHVKPITDQQLIQILDKLDAADIYESRGYEPPQKRSLCWCFRNRPMRKDTDLVPLATTTDLNARLAM